MKTYILVIAVSLMMVSCASNERRNQSQPNPSQELMYEGMSLRG